MSEISTSKSIGITVTHPEKVMFPCGITKLQLVKYYAEAAPRMLPYLKERALSLVCCPAGIEKETFFRRHLEGKFPGAVTGDVIRVTQERGILSLAQYNAVEFHVCGSRIQKNPDILVFDLDPDEGLSLAATRRGAQDLRAVLSRLGLVGFLKTSGGKGYHVVVPLRVGADPTLFREFAEKVAVLLERTFPDRYTSSVSKKARAGKIYIDWQRNSPGATSAAPYTVRARANAPVSMPIAWEELSRVSPDGIDLARALKRLHGPDPWEDFFAVKKKQSL